MNQIKHQVETHIPELNDLAPWNDQWPNLPFALNEHVSWGLGWGIQNGFQEEEEPFFHWGDNGIYSVFGCP